jgi:hypothetical protein
MPDAYIGTLLTVFVKFVIVFTATKYDVQRIQIRDDFRRPTGTIYLSVRSNFFTTWYGSNSK